MVLAKVWRYQNPSAWLGPASIDILKGLNPHTILQSQKNLKQRLKKKDIYLSMLTEALFASQKVGAIQLFTDRWIRKYDVDR